MSRKRGVINMKCMLNLEISNSDTNFLKTIPSDSPCTNKKIRQKAISDLIQKGQTPLKVDDLLNIVAPDDYYDFFISHSRDDIDKVKSISALLRRKGYKVFVDSDYWLHFDEIASLLNKNHFHDDGHGNKVYDHDKTKEIQKHCDVMLTASLAKVMKKSKVLLFVNTPSSVVSLD